MCCGVGGVNTIETCTRMRIAGIPRNRGNPARMETSVAGFPRGRKQMLRDSRGDETKLCGIPRE